MNRVGSQRHRNKKEKIVREVGHLPELYEDARSEKHKQYKTAVGLTPGGSINCK
jgi:hypothetical protein